MSGKKYVPQGVYLVCDKGAKPSELKSLSYTETTLFGEHMCTRVDKILNINFAPFGVCTVSQSLCTAPVTDWTNLTDGITLGGNELLLENSELPCALGGKIKIFYSKQAAMSALPKPKKGFWRSLLSTATDVVEAYTDFNIGVAKGLWKGAKGLVTGVADLAVWAGKHTVAYAIMNPQGFAEQLQKDVEMAKSLGNLAAKGGKWVYRNSSINRALNPSDYLAAQAENRVMMGKLYEKAKTMSAEDWGEFAGQIAFEVVQDVATAGAGLYLTGAKVVDKTLDVAKAANALDNAIDTGKALDKLEDAGDVGKIAEEVGDVVHKKSLLNGEGDIGPYKELNNAGSVGDDITPHHMPSDAYMQKNGIEGYNRNDGMSMNMEMPFPGKGGRHRRTLTYDNNMTKAQQEAYWNLSPRDALAHDIKDARRIYMEDGLYDNKMRENLQEYLKEIKNIDIFNK